jgi:hypothetical protein
MNQLTQINVDQLLAFAQQFDRASNNTSIESSMSLDQDELLEIFHTYNARDFYTKNPKLYAGTTKCCATGTCISPNVFH